LTQTQISKYVPKKKIRSVGAYYTVYEAVQSGLNRPVELRVLNHEIKQDSPEFKRFTNEFRTLANLDHPNVIRVLDLGVVQRHVFYVTDLRRSSSLRDLLEDLTFEFSIRDVTVMFRCLASALAHLHKRQIIHRSLSKDSVFLDLDTKTPYIAEFSMVKNFNLDNLTSAGIPQMVEYLRTPEFANGLPIDETVDQYLLGELIFAILTRDALRGVKTQDLENEYEEDERRHPRTFNKEVPVELDEIVARCLSPDPTDRYESAAELRDVIEVAEQKVSVKFMLSKISETNQEMKVSRHLEKHAKNIQDAQDRNQTKRFQILHEEKKAERLSKPASETRRYNIQTRAGKIHHFWDTNKKAIQIALVPAVVMILVGGAVYERQQLMAEENQAAMKQKAAKKQYAIDPDLKFDARVEEMAAQVKIRGTTTENFSDRWYLLNKWVIQLQREGEKPPFTSGDLIDIRKDIYQDAVVAGSRLDGLYTVAMDWIFDHSKAKK